MDVTKNLMKETAKHCSKYKKKLGTLPGSGKQMGEMWSENCPNAKKCLATICMLDPRPKDLLSP